MIGARHDISFKEFFCFSSLAKMFASSIFELEVQSEEYISPEDKIKVKGCKLSKQLCILWLNFIACSDVSLILGYEYSDSHSGTQSILKRTLQPTG